MDLRPAPRRPDPRTAGTPPVPPRLGTALALLGRYVEGRRVTERARSGVVRLTGLTPSERTRFDRLLREAGIEVEAPGAARETRPPETAGPARRAPRPVAAPSRSGSARASTPPPPPPVPPDLAQSLAVARRVLDEDRNSARPDARLLGAAAEVGLSVLLRGGPARMGVEPSAEEIAALPRDDLRRRAYDCLVLHNQGLSRACLKGFTGRGLEDEDLVQHGMLGVMRAARKFDPAKGFRFSTYAWIWVRQSMNRAIAEESTAIRIPMYLHERMRKVARTERALRHAGRPRGAADVAVATGLSVRQVDEVRRISRVTDSLDREVGDGANLGELIGARRPVPSVVEDVFARLDAARLAGLLARLTEREALVVRRRAGVFGETEATLEEIGRDLGLTRERIRQIEAGAHAKLRGFVGGPETGAPKRPARADRPRRGTPGKATREPPSRPRPKATPGGGTGRATRSTPLPPPPPSPRPAPRRRTPAPRPPWVYEGAPVLLLDGSRVYVARIDEENSRVWWRSSPASGPRHPAGFHVLRPAP
ncbi:sigma-70 family RNA polymerase sigma factor [Streptomyces hydrogenans]|uniref:sigma-70 family RNA polymerase sigma factor n=2 Tax=Streptomyces hydrogenans TaxID=1873719 RepID=UPI0037FBB1AE